MNTCTCENNGDFCPSCLARFERQEELMATIKDIFSYRDHVTGPSSAAKDFPIGKPRDEECFY